MAHDAENVGWLPALMCYVQLAILMAFGHTREFLGGIFGTSTPTEKTKRGYARLLVAFEDFYIKRIYHRFEHAFNRPVTGTPGAYIDVVERNAKYGDKNFLESTGNVRHCLNLGSYNYLGFADDWMNTCSKDVLDAVENFGLASSNSAMEFGTTTVHEELEKAVAKYVGKPAAIVYNMGYATNSTSIPALMGKGSLIISDSLNHNSIVNGARASGATVATFRHNDPQHLDRVLRSKIVDGHPHTRRAWTKILVMVEGIYSMEGEIVDLRAIVNVAKKYKAYIYVDEAHSIGALGKTGRGVCEYCNVDPSEIDILMGTFTKSFGAMGGYVAASEEIISFMRGSSAGANYSTSLSPVIATQVLTALRIIDTTELGKQKIASLRENSNYFRQKLNEMGLVTLGDFDSPVIPVMIYSMSKIGEFSHECFKRNLAVVTVGYPATPLLLARVRFCVSAAHTRADIDDALKKIEEVATICHVRFNKSWLG
ncbi:hypothetical protein Poli38472_009549 [Pythium oligandrum]|uniref:serine C-palmitoyltransferase n=1 Tax=Pythium oligandrum TaxID=41045 RepID=A0A8K1FGV4_PYTOL|nr:hypothetical protein Poli38472_009549 [Pythium oligandrum]|eukprot:TMW62056.1 hypothetical protein Poli38472_009549 [Pythium oligandrum]